MIAWAVAGVINGDVAFAGFAAHSQVAQLSYTPQIPAHSSPHKLY